MAKRKLTPLFTKNRTRKNRVTWYRSDKKVTAEDIADYDYKMKTDMFKELFKQTSGKSIVNVEKLITNLIADSSTIIVRNERSYDITLYVNNKDESYMSLVIYNDSIDIACRINEDINVNIELHFNLYDKFQNILDNLYIEQQIKKLDNCISEFYSLTSIDRKDKLKKIIDNI